MGEYKLIGFFLVLTIYKSECWLFQGRGDVGKSAVAIEAKGQAGRFEMKAADDKFLVQAQPYLQLSPLDKCNYLVINHIKKSCSDMAEEELNKMAVHLLNCQLLSENRPEYQCEESMSIGECTSQMDPTMWNAYQIVANRARAVCYSTRQQIFRIKTEAAVNQLVQTSQDQITSMEKLTEDQAMLGKITTETMQKVDSTQQEMLLRHERIKSSQAEMEQHIVKNLKSLTREKSLIAAGQKEIADMTEGLRAKLERTATVMEKQGEIQAGTHEEILKDLANIREQAQEVMEKMSGNAATMAAYQTMTATHYEETLASLKQVNDSVNFVIATVNTLQEGLYEKMGWIEVALGGTGDKVAFLKTVCSHILYLLLAVLSAIFLRTPPFTRLFLLLLIPLNALAEIRQKSSLDFTLMTLFILLTATANFTFNLARAIFATSSFSTSPKSAATDEPISTALATQPGLELTLSKSRKSSSSRRKRSRSRSRGRRVSTSSSSEDTSAEDTMEASTDPTFVPDSELEETMPSRLSSTLIGNANHLTHNFGSSDVLPCLPGINSLANFGTLVPNPVVGFPDRSYSDTALSSLRLVGSGGGKATSGPPAAPLVSAPPPLQRQVLANVTLNASAFPKASSNASKASEVNSSGYSSATSTATGADEDTKATDSTLRRSRRRSTSRGRVGRPETPERQSDKENNDVTLRSQSLITQHFGEVDGGAGRGKTPPQRLSATFDGRSQTPPFGAPKTPPRGRTPPRGANVSKFPCAAQTKNGGNCRNWAQSGRDFCGMHLGRSPAKL